MGKNLCSLYVLACAVNTILMASRNLGETKHFFFQNGNSFIATKTQFQLKSDDFSGRAMIFTGVCYTGIKHHKQYESLYCALQHL